MYIPFSPRQVSWASFLDGRPPPVAPTGAPDARRSPPVPPPCPRDLSIYPMFARCVSLYAYIHPVSRRVSWAAFLRHPPPLLIVIIVPFPPRVLQKCPKGPSSATTLFSEVSQFTLWLSAAFHYMHIFVPFSVSFYGLRFFVLAVLLIFLLLLLLPLLLLLLLLLLLFFLLLLRRRRLLLHPPPLGVYGGSPRPLFFCMLPRFPHNLHSPGTHFWTGWWGYAKRLEFL